MLTRDPSGLLRLMLQNMREDAEPLITHAEEWLADPRNFALVEGDDLSLFMAEGEWPGPLHAHVFFASRGKQALEIARRMLGQAFGYGATEIIAQTDFRDAAMFARLLGFKPSDDGTFRLLHNNFPGHKIAA
jgi:hypothetical protein